MRKCSFVSSFFHKTTPGVMMTAITLEKSKRWCGEINCLANKGWRFDIRSQKIGSERKTSVTNCYNIIKVKSNNWNFLRRIVAYFKLIDINAGKCAYAISCSEIQEICGKINAYQTRAESLIKITDRFRTENICDKSLWQN